MKSGMLAAEAAFDELREGIAVRKLRVIKPVLKIHGCLTQLQELQPAA